MTGPRMLVGPSVALAALLAPAMAQAHLMVTGMGPVYDGIVHFALTPEDGLAVAALALFAGLRGPAPSRLMLWVLPAAWGVGGLSTCLSGLAPPASMAAVATALLLLALGGLLASDIRLATPFCAAIAVTVGLIRGAADLAGAPAEAGSLLDLFGMCAAAFALFALAASVTLPLKRFWMIVAARVAGSWVAAAGLLLAGWIIRFGARAS